MDPRDRRADVFLSDEIHYRMDIRICQFKHPHINFIQIKYCSHNISFKAQNNKLHFERQNEEQKKTLRNKPDTDLELDVLTLNVFYRRF